MAPFRALGKLAPNVMSTLPCPCRLVLMMVFLACASPAFAQAPVITAISSPRQIVTKGQSLTLSVTAPTATSFQWKRSGRPIAGATAASYVIANASPLTDNGWYQAVATNASGATTSAVVFVNVRPEVSQVVSWGEGGGIQNLPAGLTDIVRVAPVDSAAAALRADGTVVLLGSGAAPPVGLSEVVDLDAGASHFLALRSDGTVVAWGGNAQGQSTVPAGLQNVVAVAGGYDHSLALLGNGTVVAWGNAEHGATAVPSGLGQIIGIAAGSGFSLALRSDLTVVGWGRNASGESSVPSSASSVIAISAGTSHSLALLGSGDVLSWGATEVTGRTPSGLATVRKISAGSSAVAALKSDGTVVTWGASDAGQLVPPGDLNQVLQVELPLLARQATALREAAGDLAPTIVAQPTPQSAFAGQNVRLQVGVSAGTALLTYQWRLNGIAIGGATRSTLDLPRISVSQAGGYDVVVGNWLETRTSDRVDVAVDPRPAVSLNLGGSQIVASGGSLTVSASTLLSGSVGYQWRRSGRLIPGATHSSYVLNNASARDSGVYQVVATNAVGAIASQPLFVVVAASTQVVAWGENSDGQAAVPAVVSDAISVAAGFFHSLALKSDGSVVAWGRNVVGQANVPVGLSGVVAISANGNYSLALRADGTVRTWGSINYTPGEVRNAIAIAAGPETAMALSADGTVVAWTAASVRSDTPGGLQGVVSIAAGENHFLAAHADGTVVAWGTGSSAVVPAGLTGVVAVAAGSYHSLALKADGTVVQWGESTVAVPAGLGGVSSLSAVNRTSYAIKADGTLASWTYSGSPPTPPQNLGSLLLVAAGPLHALALRDPSADSPPVFATHPFNQTVAAGAPAGFSVAVTGNPSAVLNWQRQAAGTTGFVSLSDGSSYSGVSTPSLSLAAVSLAQSGDQFRCVATNPLGTVVSHVATLTVTLAPPLLEPPQFTSADATTFASGVANTFTVTAIGLPAPTFSVSAGTLPAWASLNATTGVISGTPPSAAGSPHVFTLRASNSAGSATQVFTLTVPPPAVPSALASFSVRLTVPPEGVSSTFRISGSSARTVLIRGVGPALALFGIGGTMTDPQLVLTNGATGGAVAANDSWNASDAPVFAEVGAFNFGAGSKDAAIVATLPAGTYTVRLQGGGGAIGVALLEIFDVAGGGGGSKLSYLSFTGPVGTGDNTLVAGFGLNGTTSPSLLVRAIGPGLNLPGALVDPALTISSGSTVVAANDNWPFNLATTFAQAGALGLAIGSKDSAWASTLPPGLFTAQVSGVGGATGIALLEIFDVDASSPSTAPHFAVSPVSQSVAVGSTVTFSALALGPGAPTYQWRKDGADLSGATGATLILSGVQTASAGAYDVVATASTGTAVSPPATLAVILPAPPSIVSATGPATLDVGQGALFTVVATGTGPLSYQWRKDTVALPGATNSTLPISNAQLSHAGSYDVLVTNPGGLVTSPALFLAVLAHPPAIVTPPVGGTLAVGGGILLSVVASGSPTLTYQWRRNGLALPGATKPSLGIPNAQTYDHGDYVVVVTNPYGTATSAVAQLTVVPRAVAFSARLRIGSEAAIGVFTIEGDAPKQILLRAVGPGLATFGVTGLLGDPQLEVYNAAAASIASNNDWGAAANAPAVATATAAVGGFALSPGSRDSALLLTLAPGSYTVRAGGANGTGGVAYLELYDADLPSAAGSLPFVAVRGRVSAGEGALIGGLAANGRGVRSYLLRAIGPALGLPGVFADPSLLAVRDGTLVGLNEDWDAVAAEGTATAAAAARVAAFPLPPGARDAALVLTGNLHGGAHTAQIAGADGTPQLLLLELHDLDPARPAAFAPVIVSPPVPQTALVGAGATLAARAHGTAPLAYQWRKDGLNVPGATTSTLALAAATLSDGGLYSVVVTNAHGSATSLPAFLTVQGGDGGASAAHASTISGYHAGEILTIVNTLAFPDTTTGVGWEVELPAGWVFIDDTTTGTQAAPVAGTTGRLEWAWSTPPPGPLAFSYRVSVPAGTTGPQSLTATAHLRNGTDPAQTLPVAPSPLTLATLPPFHAADTNLDRAFSLFELTRVIELYNTRHGTQRTGAYRPDADNREDGFAGEPARAPGAAVVLTRYHSADTRGAVTGTVPDGAIDLFELTRVIELYNTRAGTVRTGRYHVQAGTEDGFAGGP